MFGRSFSFWRPRTTKTSPVPADASAERRVWVRYPADVVANVAPAQGVPAAGPHNRVSARVRDISLGGANLLVERPFEAGQMVTLELPQHTAEDKQTVLACVVRAERQSEGQWALGCVFSRELTDDDLARSGASRVRHEPSDQRTWKRFPTDKLKAKYQKIGDPKNRDYDATVINLSASGVGLGLSEAVDTGALLSVDLIGADDRIIRTILACIVQVANKPDGGWAVGCNFIRELSEQDLAALVQ
jgi:hypothetical protein